MSIFCNCTFMTISGMKRIKIMSHCKQTTLNYIFKRQRRTSARTVRFFYLDTRWVASIATVAVWVDFAALFAHFDKQSSNLQLDSKERSTFSGLRKSLCGFTFINNLVIMCDALVELAHLACQKVCSTQAYVFQKHTAYHTRDRDPEILGKIQGVINTVRLAKSLRRGYSTEFKL